jgi:hypothetical protein
MYVDSGISDGLSHSWPYCVHSHSMIDVFVLYKLTLFISSILFVVDQLHVDVTLMSLVRLQKLDVIIVL